MTDTDTIALAAAAILDDTDWNQPHWHILADWLHSVLMRAEAGETDIDYAYAVTFSRALMEGD